MAIGGITAASGVQSRNQERDIICMLIINAQLSFYYYNYSG